MSLIEEGTERKIRMANLAIVGSHSTNGVAAIHPRLLRTTTVKDLAEMFPERFNNKTNGVTPRRWLLLANPALAGGITEAIGEAGSPNLADLRRLKPLADDTAFRRRVSARPSARPSRSLPTGSRRSSGQIVDPGHDLRLPGQAHPRIQAATAQRPAHHRAVQPAAGEPGPRDDAADVLLRRQGGPRLSSGQADHQVHQQPGRRRSTAIRWCAAGSRSCFCPSIACRWPSG